MWDLHVVIHANCKTRKRKVRYYGLPHPAPTVNYGSASKGFPERLSPIQSSFEREEVDFGFS